MVRIEGRVSVYVVIPILLIFFIQVVTYKIEKLLYIILLP